MAKGERRYRQHKSAAAFSRIDRSLVPIEISGETSECMSSHTREEALDNQSPVWIRGPGWNVD